MVTADRVKVSERESERNGHLKYSVLGVLGVLYVYIL